MELIAVKSNGELVDYKKLKPVLVDDDLYVLSADIYREYYLDEILAAPIQRPASTGKRVHLELTNACNNACHMCPRKKMSRSVTHMTYDIFKWHIDRLVNKGIFGLWLYGLGEPLLHPDFAKMLHYIKHLPLGNIWLSTNCTLLDDRMCHLLLASSIRFLNLSINGTNQEEYNKWTNGSYTLVENNVARLISLKTQYKPFIRAQTIAVDDFTDRRFIEKYITKVDIVSINYLEERLPDYLIKSNGEIYESPVSTK